ncbi:hypothetical protein ACFQVC_19090 [Streptomyces monticola]|uniref:Uncharacterized protein n=1 Tax=Streptomyces monticola TaxID=2666263 RepID=A0ABW2JLJ9_9ACTN
MTQSGQGEEPQLPAARPAHEGVVLPADGGEPLMPGTYGDRTVPAGGSPWGQPWGPESAAPGTPPQGETYASGQAWAQDPHQQGQYQQDPHQQGRYEQDPHQQGRYQQDPYAQQQPAQPEQPYASAPAPQQQSYGAGQPQQPQQPQQSYPEAPQQPQPPHAQPQQQPQPPQGAPALPPQQGPGGALPPAGPDAEATQYIAPVPGAGAELPPEQAPQQPQQPQGAQLPPEQIPQTGHGSQSSPLPGALPPEAPAADATQFLGRQQMPLPQQQPQAPAPGGNPDAEATQYIAPVPPAPGNAPYGIRPGAPGDRQPPAEFDSLFRSEPAGGADSTQQMPRFDQPPAQGPGGPGGPGPQPYGHGHGGYGGGADDGGRRGGSGRSKTPVLAALGVGIVVLGLGAGYLLSSGGGDEKQDEPKNVSDSAPVEKPSPSTDPAKEQAVALDKLLAESNDSRAAVIRSVANIERCHALGTAAKDLREAAKQRNDLVTRLGQLEVDQLPSNAQLTSALNKAWKSSAAADNHFAAWADKIVATKNACPKKKARKFPQHAAAVDASGQATQAKEQAANLWNGIAQKYGLTTRKPIEL